MNFNPLGFRRHFVISDLYTFWNSQLSFQQIIRFWCDVVARHRFPKQSLGSQVSFFSLFPKKVQKSRSKSGDRMMLAPMANRFKEGSLLEQLQNHASNYQGAPGLSTPSDPPRKKWLFSAAAGEENRISKVLVCQSQRKERFAQWYWIRFRCILVTRVVLCNVYCAWDTVFPTEISSISKNLRMSMCLGGG